ncbi:hypothetical protein AURDEDRAFT_139316 [Auricularia subglabra TFB-10046 SS5]|nr:hypothetical protein AURDEDRAFT_139316 [Auricularia subglabra TFB-10046 SS5]
MPAVFEVYNQLPTLETAEETFTSREKTMDAVRVLLGTYGHEFGLCLVHAHCLLVEGEIMLSRGNVSEPEPVSGLAEFFPERWLASGEPYEFTTRPTTSPPAALLAAFKDIVGDCGVLGLYHVDQERDGKWIEHTEGRKNILELCTDAHAGPGSTHTVTAWDFGSFDPVTLACNKIEPLLSAEPASNVCGKSQFIAPTLCTVSIVA